MKELSRVEPGLFSQTGTTTRSGYDFRRVVPAAVYFIAFLCVQWAVKASGLTDVIGYFSMTAGLSVALLLGYGLANFPAILAATIVEGLVFHGLPYPALPAFLMCLVMAGVQIAAVFTFKRLVPANRLTLKDERDLARFAVFCAAGSFVMAAAASMPTALSGSVQWNRLVIEFRAHLICFAAGIFSITPLLIIHIGPQLDTVMFGFKSGDRSLTGILRKLSPDRASRIPSICFAALSIVALALVLLIGPDQKLYAMLLFSVPLMWVAVKRGINGLSVAVPALLAVVIASFLCFEKASEHAQGLLAIVTVASVYGYLVAAGVAQKQVVDSQMDRRDSILEAVSYAAQQFLGSAGWESGLQEVIRKLGEATAVTRIYLIDNRAPNLGGQGGDPYIYEWSTPAMPVAEGDRTVLKQTRTQMIEELTGRFSLGQPYVFRTQEVPGERQKTLENLGIRSGVIIPMFVEKQWWGCLGLEQCYVDRDWPDSEVDGLRMAAQILGTLIASLGVQQQFRQLTGNIQAVFWISAPDGRTKQYVSPGYEQVWGRSCSSLQREPASWLQSIHGEDQVRVSEALSRQASGEYDEEFRVLRPDGSLRWVHDRAFPVRDQSGQVNRIVGIAEDITKQKEIEQQLRAATDTLANLISHLQYGVMVEDESRRITQVNPAFNKMFNIPVPPDSLFSVDSRLLISQTAQYSERVEKIIREGTPVLGEELEWKGRIFLRNYVPLSLNENTQYHLWQYQDITDRRHAEEQIKASLKEKEVLLKEIHHRVKNNLQIISSLLNLQSTEINDPKASQKFRESQDRVKAMALIHERLYQSNDLAKIDFSGYVGSLASHLVRSYKISSSSIRLTLEVDSIPMNLDVAIPCGLIVNELVSNALKYAFPQGREGEIKVKFSEERDKMLKLLVSDNGVGLPVGKNPEESDSLGLKLVRTLTQQLGGTLRYVNRSGFLCEISIPQAK